MRKIEHNMLAAVLRRECWKSANTEVISWDDPHHGRVTEVYLHGNIIATLRPNPQAKGRMMLELHWFTAQHFSRTTFSRMNALLSRLASPGNGCFTHKHEPFLSRGHGGTNPYPLVVGDTYSFNAYC